MKTRKISTQDFHLKLKQSFEVDCFTRKNKNVYSMSAGKFRRLENCDENFLVF
jgi:hypothetical protein